MNYTKELFHKTVGILVSSFLNDTLRHNDCCACAVGNIIAANINAKVISPPDYSTNEEDFFSIEGCEWRRNGQEIIPVWDDLFVTSNGQQIVDQKMYRGWVKKQIDVTGYKWQDLAKIEHAFECANFGESKADWMFNGLMAVVDVLCEIHGMNEEEKKESKALFVKV